MVKRALIDHPIQIYFRNKATEILKYELKIRDRKSFYPPINSCSTTNHFKTKNKLEWLQGDSFTHLKVRRVIFTSLPI